MPTILTRPWQPRDWTQGHFLGYQFQRVGQRAGDKRCDYCGRWFSWSTTRQAVYEAARNWKRDIRNTGNKLIRVGGRLLAISQRQTVNGEPIHCGSTHCQEYHHQVLTKPNIHQVERQDQADRMLATFKRLHRRKLVV